MHLKKLFLKKNQERRIKAGHLWVYSNEIDTTKSPLKQFSPGEWVTVFSAKESCLGTAYINPHALISARMLSTAVIEIDEHFFVERINKALQLRERFYSKPFYRLVYGESDLLPGLIIDRYDQVLVIQINTFGMENAKDLIISALVRLLQPTCIVLKNDSAMRQVEGLASYVDIAYGQAPDTTLVEENNATFEIPLLSGQKTGWFYDHRDNRARLNNYVKNKSVLDVFSYLGGWGIEAAKYGADHVLCIDSSTLAIETLKKNAELNAVANRIDCFKEDAFLALKTLIKESKRFDVIILDPPALIKKRKDVEEGLIAYLRLNEMAMQLLTDDGILVSCSCSLHLPYEQLLDTIRRASIKTNKLTQVLDIGFQGMDHPIHPAIMETGYLKAIFCRVAPNNR